jgi:hypothetical protein
MTPRACATCTHCEQRAEPPLYVVVRWCVLFDDPAIFPCEAYIREPGADDA